jgi:hypothetical protein
MAIGVRAASSASMRSSVGNAALAATVPFFNSGPVPAADSIFGHGFEFRNITDRTVASIAVVLTVALVLRERRLHLTEHNARQHTQQHHHAPARASLYPVARQSAPTAS